MNTFLRLTVRRMTWVLAFAAAAFVFHHYYIPVLAMHHPAYPSGKWSGGWQQAEIVRLIHDHGCWQKTAPPDMDGRVPGHVVATWRGHVVYGGPKWVIRAIHQVFYGGRPRGLKVYGFCR